MLLRCQNGFEKWLSAELSAFGCPAVETGAGWAKAPDGKLDVTALEQLCFPHVTLLEPIEVTGDSVNGMAEKIAGFFLETARTERFEGAWPLIVETAGGQDGLGRRADSVTSAVGEVLKKRMSRVAKLASTEQPWGIGEQRGLFIFFADFRRAFVARKAVFGGQRRMADDPLAPSRSYLKLEEAYGVLGREPAPNETVADLGAAPGGWSYSAAKRGARVVAIDNGPLKGGALNNPLIEHRRDDAFRFTPAAGEVFDWMFCDLVEEPHHVMRNLIEPWIARHWCRRFVVILKFGRVDPLALLRELRAPQSVFAQHASGVRIRHLFHDREELTIVGEVTP
ncbi:MAG TPA: SAM-dependent methyltransferase [Opitutaceae bacterium]|nr:SAM-dependent methyltransferase [Opitutaceae bacterium]